MAKEKEISLEYNRSYLNKKLGEVINLEQEGTELFIHELGFEITIANVIKLNFKVFEEIFEVRLIGENALCLDFLTLDKLKDIVKDLKNKELEYIKKHTCEERGLNIEDSNVWFNGVDVVVADKEKTVNLRKENYSDIILFRL